MTITRFIVSISLLACSSAHGMDFGSTPATVSRITHMGPDLDRNFDAEDPAIAFNPVNNEYFVVWAGNNQAAGISADEVEIYGQRIDASDHSRIGTAIRISFMGPAMTPGFDARSPSVTHNPATNEYLVVWHGDHDQQGQVEGELEIFMHRVDAQTGQLVGTQTRISDMGPIGNRSFDALDPVVSYNPANNNVLVVWRGEDQQSGATSGEFEIYGQMISAVTYAEIGPDDFRISTMGPNGDVAFDAFSPDIAYNEISNEFLVVWYGDDQTDEDFEIFAQRINAKTGVLVADAIQVSDVGPASDITRSARFPAVAYNLDLDQYLVTWTADDDAVGHLDDEFEIYGQLLDRMGTAIGDNDFPISSMGGVGESSFDAFAPDVIYDSDGQQYLVAWRGDNGVDGEFEIYTQRIDAVQMVKLGDIGHRLTNAGIDGNLLFDARNVTLTTNSLNGEIMLAWEEENMSADQVEGEFEIFAANIEPVSFTADERLSGSWFDPTHEGEGWVVEVIDPNNVVVFWFTYNPDGVRQAWFIGAGQVRGNRIVMSDSVITSGALFGAGFNPDDVSREVWGDFAIEFQDCNTASVTYNSTIQSYAAGRLDPVRLTTINTLGCGSQQNTVEPGVIGFSGAWFDPGRDGEGWVLESLTDSLFLLYWFTYDTQGNQAWLVGTGTRVGNEVNFGEMLIINGTPFGPAFDPLQLVRQPWGSLVMTLNDCGNIQVAYDSVDAAFGSGQLSGIRLTGIHNLECEI